jgi:DnaJ-domain-containing protein 1
MTDYFALLQEPRCPWLDPEALKAKFLHLAETTHPDRIHGASDFDKARANRRFMELTAARNCLREPKERLLHLIELERGQRPPGIESVPADLMELFFQIGQVSREVDGFLLERAKVRAPLLKVQMFERGLEWTDKLSQVQQGLNVRRRELEEKLKEMNAVWEAAPAVGSSERPAALPLDELEMAYRTFSYYARWMGQLQDRIVQLSL